MTRKAKVLIVDDEESIRFTFESFLSDEGYAVATAGDFDEALSRINETDFDLIFADIILGGRTGIDFIREVKRRNLPCPVIMITGVPNVESASEAVRLGAFDYIAKPVHYDTLIQTAKTALKHKAVTEEKERYRSNLEAIFRSVKDAIITIDQGLRVVELNEASGKICGFSREVIGKTFDSLAVGCSGKCIEMITETINKKQPVEARRLECRNKKRPGLVVDISTAPLLDRQGAFSGAVIVIKDETRVADLERDLGERSQLHHIIGRSRQMQEIYSLIDDLADLQTTVLIVGESGTGKELIAEALHEKGRRRHKPLVKVNCSALSESLLESELFGHVKGAFTGAVTNKIGRFQRADGGTIFLDEIGDISHRIQLHLLRVVQEMEFERVGDSTPIRADVRVIAATNQDLFEKVKQGEFREDLYYRLKVVELNVPPLRDRTGDIPLLVDHFLDKFYKKFNKKISAVSADVLQVFMDYPWPGNIRELEHALEHACILCRHDAITVDHLPRNIRGFTKTRSHSGKGIDERQEILRALEKSAWNKVRASRILGIDRKTLYRKMAKHDIKGVPPDGVKL